MDSRISEAVAVIRGVIGDQVPRGAIILGSGLGGFAAEIESPRSVPFAAIPHFARSTASGHRGELVTGTFGRRRTPVVAMAGRLHRYEGWSTEQVTFPVAVLAALGAEVLIVSNAAGGLNPNFRVGDLMIIRDHINLLPTSGSTRFGGPCGSASPYDAQLAAAAAAAARRGDFDAYQGTYLATLGPTYETRAEYRMMRRIGADAVGMSTVPEVLEARRRGLRVLAVSLISNVASTVSQQETDHQQVLEAGRQSEPKMRQIVDGVLGVLSN